MLFIAFLTHSASYFLFILPHLQPHLPNAVTNLVLFAVITAAGYALWALNHYFWKGADALAGRVSNNKTPKKGHTA